MSAASVATLATRTWHEQLRGANRAQQLLRAFVSPIGETDALHRKPPLVGDAAIIASRMKDKFMMTGSTGRVRLDQVARKIAR
jgi:hypothetical protein